MTGREDRGEKVKAADLEIVFNEDFTNRNIDTCTGGFAHDFMRKTIGLLTRFIHTKAKRIA